jgi:hypothetical protein
LIHKAHWQQSQHDPAQTVAVNLFKGRSPEMGYLQKKWRPVWRLEIMTI